LGRFVLSAAAGLLLAGALSWLWLKKRHAFVAERERARIAKDLHDDLGARLTRISMLTELVRRQSTQTEEGGRHAQLLAESAKEALNDMEQAIWSVSPSTDTLEHLVTFILQYAEPFLAPTGIEWNAAAPVELPNRKLQAELRRNIFLAVKEALHNVVKHSRARNAHLRITFDDPWLTVIVEDDGRGLPRDADRAGGDGLKNMRQRMAASGGRFSVECRTEGGTCVTLRAKL
jgi:signal transduction histidine kinase